MLKQERKAEETFLQVLLVLDLTIEEFFDFRVQCGKPLLLLRVREVDRQISSRRDNVELGVENIDSVYYPVKPRKGESHVTLILSNCVLTGYIITQKIRLSSSYTLL